MKNFRVFQSGSLLVILLSSSLIISASPTTSKEHKKKLLDKLRAALNSSESENPIANISTAEEAVESGDKVTTYEEVSSPVIQDEVVGTGSELATADNNKIDAELSTNNYMTRFRTVFKRIMEMLGLRRHKDGRKSRMLSFADDDNNDINRSPAYQEEVRTTVGAMLGERECIQKVACVSGSYLKTVKGKQLIFALLDVFSPNGWKETVKIAKSSAILNESCNYKCLE